MPAMDAFLGGELTFGISTRRRRVLVPSETQRCKLAVRLRPLTAQERFRVWLARTGLWRRFPKASACFTDRLPKTKHWMEWRPEIALPRVLIEQDAPNEAPAPNRRPRFPLGGWPEFEHFVAAPPASPAAVGEARCWTMVATL